MSDFLDWLARAILSCFFIAILGSVACGIVLLIINLPWYVTIFAAFVLSLAWASERLHPGRSGDM